MVRSAPLTQDHKSESCMTSHEFMVYLSMTAMMLSNAAPEDIDNSTFLGFTIRELY